MLKPQPLSATAWRTVCFCRRFCYMSASDLPMAKIKVKDVSSQRIVVSMQASAAPLGEDLTSCVVKCTPSTIDKEPRI